MKRKQTLALSGDFKAKHTRLPPNQAFAERHRRVLHSDCLLAGSKCWLTDLPLRSCCKKVASPAVRELYVGTGCN